jgi:tetratricopeptide (TPR) repeat protein
LAFLKENLPPFPFVLQGLVYRRDPAAGPSGPFLIRRDDRLKPPADYPSGLMLAHYPYMAAKAAFEKNDPKTANAEVRRAARWGDSMEWLQSNLGSLWSRWGAGEGWQGEVGALKAREYFERSVAIDPLFPAGQYGLGYVQLKARDYGSAALTFEAACRMRPHWADALYMWGLACELGGDRAAASRPWSQLLKEFPRSSLSESVRQTISTPPAPENPQ